MTRHRIMAITSTLAVTAGLITVASPPATAVGVVVSTVVGSDGRTYTAENHLTRSGRTHQPRSYLLAWAGSADASSPDFLAVIDATQHSPSYGEVVNTVTLAPQLQNEPHHMQYVWHEGDRIYAGGILSDTVYTFDTRRLPALDLVGVTVSQDTPCGSAPDAFVTLEDGRAYGSYVGGPDVAGPCTYTNGEVREGNGFAGSPGEIVLFDRDGQVISEIPATPATAEDPEICGNVPSLAAATCANPHGIQVREDLNRLVTSDFAEVSSFLEGEVFDETLVRDTVRVFDITDRSNPTLLSVSHLPVGPRAPIEQLPLWNESRVVMENAVTHLPHHRGAFASTMFGGAIYYTPDITVPDPQWREVFDDSTAYHTFGTLLGGADGGSWLAVSPDDRFLFHTVIGTQLDAPPGATSGMVYALDIRRLLAAGSDPQCHIDTLAEVTQGGAEPDCPTVAGVLPVDDATSGGPHWGALDNFRSGVHGYRETSRATRMAVSNYFVAPLGVDGDHRVCIIKIRPTGDLSVDRRFRDELTGQPCVSFNRGVWPHGAHGDARPHGVLFVINNRPVW